MEEELYTSDCITKVGNAYQKQISNHPLRAVMPRDNSCYSISSYGVKLLNTLEV